MLTAGHVAAGCTRIVIAKEGLAFAGQVVAISSQVDLALIKVPKTLGLSAVFPRSVSAGVNEMLFAADYENLPRMIARGGVLGNATVATNSSEPGYLAINSEITFGASGAPVLDSRGLVQGVVSRRVAAERGWLSNPVQNKGPMMTPYAEDKHGLAVAATEAKNFLAANHVVVAQDDRPQISASGSRANRAASISARVFCLAD